MNSGSPNRSFERLVEQARGEVPPAPDFRSRVRYQLEQLAEQRPLRWTQILVDWADRARVRYGFATAFAALLLTSYWELSRPEPAISPPMPMFVIDQFFSP